MSDPDTPDQPDDAEDVGYVRISHVELEVPARVVVTWPEFVRTLHITKPTGPDGAWMVQAYDADGELVQMVVSETPAGILVALRRELDQL